MAKTIVVSDDVYKHIQAQKRSSIKQTGMPMSDGDVIDFTFTLIGLLSLSKDVETEINMAFAITQFTKLNKGAKK